MIKILNVTLIESRLEFVFLTLIGFLFSYIATTDCFFINLLQATATCGKMASYVTMAVQVYTSSDKDVLEGTQMPHI